MADTIDYDMIPDATDSIDTLVDSEELTPIEAILNKEVVFLGVKNFVSKFGQAMVLTCTPDRGVTIMEVMLSGQVLIVQFNSIEKKGAFPCKGTIKVQANKSGSRSYYTL